MDSNQFISADQSSSLQGQVTVHSHMTVEAAQLAHQSAHTSTSVHSTEQVRSPARIANPYTVPLKPITGVVTQPRVVAPNTMAVHTTHTGEVVTTITRPLTPQELMHSVSPTMVSTVMPTISPHGWGPRESEFISSLEAMIASLRIPLTPEQVAEVDRMTQLRLEGLLTSHSALFQKDVRATQQHLLDFLSARMCAFGFSDFVRPLYENVTQSFGYKKGTFTPPKSSGGASTSTPSGTTPGSGRYQEAPELLTGAERSAAFGHRLDAYCLMDLLREAVIVFTCEHVADFCRDSSKDNNMALFVRCLDHILRSAGFNSQINNTALINFIYHRGSLKTTSVSSIRSFNSVGGSPNSSRLLRGLSPSNSNSPQIASREIIRPVLTSVVSQQPLGSHTAQSPTTTQMPSPVVTHIQSQPVQALPISTTQPVVLDSKDSGEIPAVMYVPQALPQPIITQNARSYPTTVTVRTHAVETERPPSPASSRAKSQGSHHSATHSHRSEPRSHHSSRHSHHSQPRSHHSESHSHHSSKHSQQEAHSHPSSHHSGTHSHHSSTRCYHSVPQTVEPRILETASNIVGHTVTQETVMIQTTDTQSAVHTMEVHSAIQTQESHSAIMMDRPERPGSVSSMSGSEVKASPTTEAGTTIEAADTPTVPHIISEGEVKPRSGSSSSHKVSHSSRPQSHGSHRQGSHSSSIRSGNVVAMNARMSEQPIVMFQAQHVVPTVSSTPIQMDLRQVDTSLKTSVDTLMMTLEKVINDVNLLKHDQHAAYLSVTSSILPSIKQALGVYQNEVSELRAHLSRVETEHGAKFTAHTEEMEKHRAQLDNISRLENQHLSFTSNFGTHKQDLEGRFSSYTATFDQRLRETHSDVDSRLVSLQSTLKDLESRFVSSGAAGVSTSELASYVEGANRRVYTHVEDRNSKLEHEVDSLKRLVKSLEVGALVTEIEAARRDIDTFRRGFQLDVMSKVTDVETRFDSRVTHLESLLETKVVDLQTRFLSHHAVEPAPNHPHMVVEPRISHENSEPLRSDLLELKSRIDRVGEVLATHTARVENVETQTANSVLDLRQTLDSASRNLDSLIRAVDGRVTLEVSTLNRTVEQQAQNFDARVAGEVSELNKRLHEISTNLTPVYQRVEHVEQRVASLQPIPDHNKEDVEKLKKELEQLQLRIANLEHRTGDRVVREGAQPASRSRVIPQPRLPTEVSQGYTLLSHEKIIINTSSPTNIYLTADRAEVTPTASPLRTVVRRGSNSPQRGESSNAHNRRPSRSPLSTFGQPTFPATNQTAQATWVDTTHHAVAEGQIHSRAPEETTIMMHSSSPVRTSTIPSTSYSAFPAHTHTTGAAPLVGHASYVGGQTSAVTTHPTQIPVGHTTEHTVITGVERTEVYTTSGIDGSPLARLAKQKESEQQTLANLEKHYKSTAI
eukprot:Gregarina_sp_Poly_1__7769@NODE_439_length_8392_cov_737_725405_g358_i0_p1_GENE_NODE_439_length_8392_cov_737_725405_g358_i0NODE_439_length_8392_cov_737_725405_g358_i0_p1_ORF_typecomplete_len1419_score193_84DUF3584/PF12128_8/2_1e05DUF3584/PF12128_8/0_0026Apolipoprotein/PF01442_18/0_0033Apolipoprotein/PF01442_18/0_00023Baculo_PEP_C/PF04513_12/1_7Baculo_PEP_C/PF04513_12/17Baculo_PEP_C/PF04513_12/1_9e02Baculo_PEP_C/PF04513_12/4_7Baculo_PEP_C/PF04513_12/0_14AAA_13/PF13166_6/5_9AAA_13/PF13166_6/0_45AAA_